MIKALFRKQFAELLSQFGRQSGIGGARARRPIGVVLAIFAVVYAVLCVSFFNFAKLILDSIGEGPKEIYYLMVCLVASAVGLLGSVFNAHSSIFEAKDNEMLLSLPIPPSLILLVRVTALGAMSLLYESAVLLPAFIAFVLHGSPSTLGGVSAFFSFLPLTLLVIALTLALSFLLAALVRKVKNKTVVTVIASLLLIGLFYFLYFRAQNMITELVMIGTISNGIKYSLFFFYALGRASTGSLGGLGIAFGTGAAAFALAYYLLSRNFIKLTTAKRSSAGKGKAGKVRAASRRLTLFKREWKLFTSSANYMLNSAFGVVFLTILAVVSITQADAIREGRDLLVTVLPHSSGCALGALGVMLVAAMNDITAPSISMEGRRLWLLKSLPISVSEVFFAKIAVHLVMVVPFTILPSVTLSVILGGDVLGAIFLPIASCAFVLFTACLGLCLNLRRPILDWKDETMAVKTGVSVFVSVFGSMFLVILLGALYYPAALLFSDGVYLIVVTVLLIIASVLMIRWLKRKGAALFRKIG